MTDITGTTRPGGARRTSEPLAGPREGDARIAPELKSLDQDLSAELDNADATPKDVGPSTQGDVSSGEAAAMAKAKSTTTRAAGRASSAKPAPRPAETVRPAPSLSEDDSILVAGIDRAEEEAARLRAWAQIRREEAKDAIRTHPLGSSVVVFAAGMIFGLLLARR
ncbi:MAG: hypothetical protein K1X35_02340 [Caulobacteraceae bacterium]|nr:hypothetical protein [Caulobacteraceae bacterium]